MPLHREHPSPTSGSTEEVLPFNEHLLCSRHQDQCFACYCLIQPSRQQYILVYILVILYPIYKYTIAQACVCLND